jgi:FkbM family methyltransferase
MVKTILLKVLNVLGFELRRVPLSGRRAAGSNVKPEPFGGKLIAWPPTANFDNVALVLEHFTTARPGSIFVQVGANDGETSDSVNLFVKRGAMECVLIEPIPANFAKLKAFYADSNRLHLVQAAIAHNVGSTAIYAVRDSGRWSGNAWATQLASFEREHLLRHGIYEEEIEECSVECINFPTLLHRYGLERIDVRQIDVEGVDAEVVKMALQLPHPPLVICFEFVQFVKTMDQQAVNAFYELLRSKGYSWSHDRINTMAVHESFVVSGKPAAVNAAS